MFFSDLNRNDVRAECVIQSQSTENTGTSRHDVLGLCARQRAHTHTRFGKSQFAEKLHQHFANISHARKPQSNQFARDHTKQHRGPPAA